MIKLKNGFTVEFTDDFDDFFRNLLEALVVQSRNEGKAKQEAGEENGASREIFLKILMDNCIYVTHQLFEIARDHPNFSQFMVTGFIFNSIILALPDIEDEINRDSRKHKKEDLH